MKKYLIFTDLDGTLLDHENYSYGNNKKTITSDEFLETAAKLDVKLEFGLQTIHKKG